jgi:hypothetical protein
MQDARCKIRTPAHFGFWILDFGFPAHPPVFEKEKRRKGEKEKRRKGEKEKRGEGEKGILCPTIRIDVCRRAR